MASRLGNVLSEQAPAALEVYLGGFRNASYGVWWNGEDLVYESFAAGYERRRELVLSPSATQWRRFWRSMDRIRVWDWSPRHDPNARFEPDDVVRDGTHWSLMLAHAGREVEASGDSAGPDGRDLDDSPLFSDFCGAVARLLGGRAFA